MEAREQVAALLPLLWSMDRAVTSLTREREALHRRHEHQSWSEAGAAIIDLVELRSELLRICYPGRIELTEKGYAVVRAGDCSVSEDRMLEHRRAKRREYKQSRRGEGTAHA